MIIWLNLLCCLLKGINMVTLNASGRKIKIWTRGKNVQFITESQVSMSQTLRNLHSQKTELTFHGFKFWFFFVKQLRVTLLDWCISLFSTQRYVLPVSFPVDLLQWQLWIHRKRNWKNAHLCSVLFWLCWE